ncbi:MAG: lysophospholipid acyltransferase family protein [Gemmatimonadota bacterium]
MIRTLLFSLVAVISTTFFSFVSVVGGLLGAPKGLHDWVHRRWSASLLHAAGVRVRAGGLRHIRRDGPQIFVSNHQSMFDIWALMTCLPVSIRFVAKEELSRIPLFARACRSAGHVFIDRGDRTGAIRRMQEAGKRMDRENLSLGLFPEGTRSPDGRLQPFKKGTFVLAIETQAPLVPVAVDGGARILPKGKRRVVPGTLDVRFGSPIPTRGLTIEDRDTVLELTRSAIEELLAELRATSGPE